MEIFDRIRINLNPEKIGKKLLIKGARDWAQFQTLLETVKPLILPKAAYRVRYVSEKDEDLRISRCKQNLKSSNP